MKRLLIVLLMLTMATAIAAPPVRTFVYTAGNIIQPAEVTKNEDNIFQYLTTGVDTLADNCVTTSKILDGSVTSAKILAGVIAANVESVPWTDYSGISTVGGWAAGVTSEIYYKKIGHTVFVNFNITGVSNANSCVFTLPYISAAGTGIAAPGLGMDAGALVINPTSITLAAASLNVIIWKDYTGALWNVAGAKIISGQFWYQTP